MSPAPPASLDAASAARLVLEAHRRGLASIEAVILEGPFAGARLVLRETDLDPHLLLDRCGSLGPAGRALEAAIAAAASPFIREEDTPGARGGHAGTRSLAPAGGDPVDVYFELHSPVAELVIVGAGHLARPLTQVGVLLGFRVIVLDDRPDFARRERFPAAAEVARVDFRNPFGDHLPNRRSHHLLVTRGHRFDYECLRRLLVHDPAPRYIGMIGSRRRVRATFHQLVEEGFTPKQLSSIRAPVGLDLGAETPEEIAIAVAAELVRDRRGGSGLPLSEKERIAERFFSSAGEAREP